MRYIRLGNTGLIVSRFCLGAMTFGNHPALPSIYKVDEQSAGRMTAMALEAGINFFDTADSYGGGQSEAMIGKLLASRRHDVVIATKVGFRTGEAMMQAGLSRRHVLASCDASLSRLKTDYIDLYIAHKEDPFTPLEETLEAFNDLVRAGKVRYIGFSNWQAWKAALALQMQKERGWAQFTSGQMYYSLVGRDIENEIAPFIQYAGLGLTVWSPLAGGFLSGKYTSENLGERDYRLSGFDFLPFDKERGFQVVDKMREIARELGVATAAVALAWLSAKPVVSSVIIGAGKPQQLEENLKAASLSLSDAQQAELDRMTATTPVYPHWFNTYLTDAKQDSALKDVDPS